MANPVALAATQAADAAAAVCSNLYHVVRFAQPAADNADIPDKISTVAHSLDTMAKFFVAQPGTSVFSEHAVQDANDLIARCDAIFTELRQLIEKRWYEGRGSQKDSAAPDPELTWPISEQSTGLLRHRLVNVEDSLALMLHILHFANVQAQGDLPERDREEERNKVRELHLRQQNSLEALKAFESKLNNNYPSDGEAFQTSSIPSRVPTIDFIVNTQGPSRTPPAAGSMFRRATATTVDHFSQHSLASDSDDTVTDDDEDDDEEGERSFTQDELAQCAAHVQELLKGIGSLQNTYNVQTGGKARYCPRFRVHKLYKRFRRRFESEMSDQKSNTATSAVPFPGFQPPQTSHNDLASPRSQMAAPDLRSNSVYSFESPNRTLAPVQELRRTQSVGTQSQYANQLLSRPTHNGLPSNSRDERALHPHFRTSDTNPSTSTMNISHVQNEITSRESSKEGSQSGGDRDGESISGRSAPIHYTKTGRISKAKKGLKVHTCSECGKSFTRAEHLRRHQKNHGPDQVTCDLCGKVFFRVDLLMRHIERHKDGPHPASTNQPLAPSRENFDDHRSAIYPARQSADMNSVEPSQAWRYAWEERDRGYMHTPKRVLSGGDERNLIHESAPQPRTLHSAASPSNPARVQSTTYDDTGRESGWQNPNKRRRTEGDIHRAPYSPLHSPPSPWIKEHRKLPPLPSPLQATYNQSPYSGPSDNVKALRSISPSTGPTWTHVNSPQNSTPRNSISQSIQPAQSYDDSRKLANSQSSMTDNTTRRRPSAHNVSATTLTSSSKPGSLQETNHESPKHRPIPVSKSQSTSPTTNPAPRIYPNPFRPHQRQVRLETDSETGSRKRKPEDNSVDGQQQQQRSSMYTRHAPTPPRADGAGPPNPDRRDASSSSYTAKDRHATPERRNPESEGKKKDVMDKLLDHYTVPSGGITS
ncbi:unnamed protein product [Periconia digitata]|uniref:C2H2-type domain-containing protein n=1 Tax=Periconia digitata TaxID=1303443 RepID=A0A9W4UUR5_9PLEO|nr:unnamed protein product [Periconia digitata]